MDSKQAKGRVAFQRTQGAVGADFMGEATYGTSACVQAK